MMDEQGLGEDLNAVAAAPAPPSDPLGTRVPRCPYGWFAWMKKSLKMTWQNLGLTFWLVLCVPASLSCFAHGDVP